MSTTPSIWSQSLLSRITWYALATLLLTTVHHVYAAYVYQTPWRLHAALVSVLAAAAIVGPLTVLRSRDDVARRIALWVFVGVTLVVPVALIGLFEGGYNHVLKNLLYFGGASASLMSRLFPPPTYELPNDVFFEITGMLQVVPASAAGWLLHRLLQSRSSASTPAPDVSVRMARQADKPGR